MLTKRTSRAPDSKTWKPTLLQNILKRPTQRSQRFSWCVDAPSRNGRADRQLPELRVGWDR
jgi:hypothetical protein